MIWLSMSAMHGSVGQNGQSGNIHTILQVYFFTFVSQLSHSALYLARNGINIVINDSSTASS